MFTYFKNVLMITRNTNVSFFKKCKSSRLNVISRHVKRTFSLCGCIYKNYSEKFTNFNGVQITIKKPYDETKEFEEDLIELFKQWQIDGRRSVFMQVPISESHLISVASRYGFKYHHARDDHAVLSLWLDKHTKSKLPNFANHTLGVAGACFNQETREILLIQDNGMYNKWWKFPGGFAELYESIGECAVRETFEETGIESKFEAILAFSERNGTLFNQSDFYFVTRLHPLTTEINPCPEEIKDCRWFDIDEVFELSNCSPFVKRCCNLLLKGSEFGFNEVDITGVETKSWVRPDYSFYIYQRTPFVRNT